MDGKFQRIEKKKTIDEIESIMEPRNVLIKNREDIKKFVEAPLLAACEEFYDKNIRTLESSCNQSNITTGKARIIIDYNNLSPENQLIASSISAPVQYDDLQAVIIEIPIQKASFIDEISKVAKEIAHRFHSQSATWIPTYTFETMCEMYSQDPNDPEIEPALFTNSPEHGLDWYWDEETKLFYPSEELYLKATK